MDLEHSFLNDTFVSDDCSEFGKSVIAKAGKTMKWCMLCLDMDEELHERISERVDDIEYFYDLPTKDTLELVRVDLFWRFV